MTNGNDALFDEIKRLMEEREIPPKIDRRMQWAALTSIYEEQKALRPVVAMTKNLRVGFRVLAGVVGLLVIIHLGQVAQFGEALWKWFITFV